MNMTSARKFVKSNTITMGFSSKVVREFYPSLTNKPAEDTEFKKAIQVDHCYLILVQCGPCSF